MRITSKWGRRILITAGVLLVAALLGHGIWIYGAGWGLRSRVAVLKSAGEPILPNDFATTNPDAPDNAGPDIAAVGQQVAQYTASSKLKDLNDVALPLRPQERAAIQAALTDLAPALVQLDQARAKPRAEWKLDFTRPLLVHGLVSETNRLNGPRALCRLLCWDAMLDHANGDDASALQRLDRAIFISRYSDKHPSLIGHLVSMGCMALAAYDVMELAPDLKIGQATGDASPQDVRAMIDLLLDDVPQREGLHLALRGERMMQLDAVQSILDGIPVQARQDQDLIPGSGNAFVRYAMRPLFYHNASYMLSYMNKQMDVVDAPDMPAARPMLATKPKDLNPVHLLAAIIAPALERFVETHHRLSSDRRLAAITLAIRWYAVEHDGKRPEKLEDLVPRYLPAVPKDSLLRDQPLHYIPDPVDPRIYSAGANNQDDGGNEAWIKPRMNSGQTGQIPGRGGEWETLDRIVHLNRPPRPPEEKPESADSLPPSTEPAATGPTESIQP